MNRMFPKLFEWGGIGGLELKNRIIKAPQHTGLAARDGSVTERQIRHYKEIARGGTGLVIVDFAFVDNKGSQGVVCQTGVSEAEHIPGLSLLAHAIQAYGAKAALQIAHMGRERLLGPPIKAPSRMPPEDTDHGNNPEPEELTIKEIQELVSAFGDAARRAQIAGFNMVEIHGAHGYLITTFLSPRTNKRTDLYGGSRENRMRFLLEIIKDIRQKVGQDFPLGVRLSGTEYEPDGIMIEDTIALSEMLEKLGVDVVHISGGNYHQTIQRVTPMSIPPGPMIWMAEAVKKEVGIPVIASGSITTPELANEILENGKADFVALGRPLLADPHWPQKAKEGRPEDIVPCIRCNEGCLYRGIELTGVVSCTVNVALGKEDEFAITPVKHSKKVAVVGGGPAGIEAALVCTLRGHEVVLYEKRKLGGALLEASFPEFKSDLRRLISYFVTQIEKLELKVIYEEANVNTIINGGFDAAIVATGGTPITLDVPGINKPIVTTALEVLNGRARVGRRVLVVGGGLVGTEVGLFLAEQGREVILIEMLNNFMIGVGARDRMVYEERLARQNVTIYTGTRLEAVLDKGAIVAKANEKREEILVDSVVIAVGFAPQTELSNQLKSQTSLDIYTIGDCLGPRRIFDAIHEGFIAGYSIM
ncbi:FAD-dependent oxidoreductase [Chloroflexota bacterium]